MDIKQIASQPRKHSLYESLFNVLVGFIIGLISNEVVLQDVTEPELGRHLLDWAMKEDMVALF